MNDMNRCLEELFSIMECKPRLAERLFSVIPKEKLDIAILGKYYDHKNSKISDFAVMSSLNAFKGGLSLIQLLGFLKSKDLLVLEKVRDEALSVPIEYIGLETLLCFFKNDDWLFAHEVIGELLIKHFWKRLGWKNLIEMQRLSNANTRSDARKLFLREGYYEFNFENLLDFTMNENFYISLLAKETLLNHFPSLLKMETLINFQNTPDEYIRAKAKKICLGLPEHKLNYTRLLSFSVNNCIEAKHLAQELMLKKFSKFLSGRDIMTMQSSKSKEVQVASRMLALSLRSDRFEEKHLKRCLSSSSKETRELASLLLDKFNPPGDVMEATTMFVLKYNLHS